MPALASADYRPGAVRGLYPQRTTGSPPSPSWYYGLPTWSGLGPLRMLRVANLLERVHHHRRQIATSSESLVATLEAVRRQLRHDSFTSVESVARAFALISQLSGQTIGRTPYDTQLIAGWGMLHGFVAEMDTGEGKTLAAVLPAAVAALAGIPVHIATANDYLAERDATSLRPLYEALGLSVGVVTGDIPINQRAEQYLCDVAYCNAKELVFDFLRDGVAGQQHPGRESSRVAHAVRANGAKPALRGLCFAIVDECDSVLVDDAKTPLVLARPSTQMQAEAQRFEDSLAIASELIEGQHYRIDRAIRSIEFTRNGVERADAMTEGVVSQWERQDALLRWVKTALGAIHLYRRDHDYVVDDETVQIVDENTGRVRPGHMWEHGLHQMIECKEGCALSEPNESLARITYQRFFRKYLHLTGMSGTVREVRRELKRAYGLGVLRIPTHRPSQRINHGRHVFRNNSNKWDALLARVKTLHNEQRPLLIGTRSVSTSEILSERLSKAGLVHHVLSARQDADEATVVASAGQLGQITVATNMAGRGTDIVLGAGVTEVGGLHIIAAERHDARRIDRQLYGRGARQGDPGSFELYESIEDEICLRYLPSTLKHWCAFLTARAIESRRLFSWVPPLAQRMAEYEHAGARRALLRADKELDDLLGFSGRRE